jgi:hypothetical protein
MDVKRLASDEGDDVVGMVLAGERLVHLSEILRLGR